MPPVVPTIPPAQNMIERGSTTHYQVWYADPNGPNGSVSGAAIADAILGVCEANYTQLQERFGHIQVDRLPFVVNIWPGYSAAFHPGCLDTDIYITDFDGKDKNWECMMVVAEVAEVLMANLNRGWDCSASNGEALSRVLAFLLWPDEIAPASLAPVTGATGSSWLDSARPNWVDTTEQTDTNLVSIGCGTLFINWLRNQLGFSLEQIVQTGGATLADLYRSLTGRTDGFQRFSDLLAQRFPPGQLSGLVDDNPFPIR